MPATIFLDFHLPNAATWVYFSLVLAVAAFFQFTRLLSVRNLDLLALYALAPGFLLLQDAGAAAAFDPVRAGRERLAAYGWLLAGSGYWLARAVFDLSLVRRPVLAPNVTAPGLAWLAFALFLCLTAVAARPTADAERVGKPPMPISQVEEKATAVVQQAQTAADRPAAAVDVRFWVERGLAMGCHLAVVVGLVLIGLRHFGDLSAGLAAATLYLLVPYTALNITQVHHVWPAAFLTWAVYAYRRPAVSGWLLGLAAGSAFFPLLLFPLWCGFYARRGAWRFAAWFAAAGAVSFGVTAAVLLWDGRFGNSVSAALKLTDWQPWRMPQAESIWAGVHWAYRLPVFVAFCGFLGATAVWPGSKNLGHLMAQSAAVLIGVQFWYADRGGVYVLWYLPLVLLMVFRPNLTGAEPPVAAGAWAWPTRGWRKGRQPTPPNQLAV